MFFQVLIFLRAWQFTKKFQVEIGFFFIIVLNLVYLCTQRYTPKAKSQISKNCLNESVDRKLIKLLQFAKNNFKLL